jgi:IS1 family transposase
MEFAMNRLTSEKRIAVLQHLCEGSSINSTVRLTGVSKATILKLLSSIGTVCREYQEKVFRDLPCKRLQLDEIWSFCYVKQDNVPKEMRGIFGYGDVWTWTAIDSETKIVPYWLVGLRNAECAHTFVGNLKSRLKNRVQLTTDGLRFYVTAVSDHFGQEVDCCQLEKLYGKPEKIQPGKLYPVSECVGTRRIQRSGNPDPRHVSTSFVERHNLSMRMGMRRFTRSTNAFSKKIENHTHAISLYFMYYNFARIHQTLRMTPAMAAGVSDRVWTMKDIVALLEPNEK